jgi:hypothetical protein
MKNSRRLQENITPQEELLVEPILNEAKEPGFVEIINNRIYFYADIDREKTLERKDISSYKKFKKS